MKRINIYIVLASVAIMLFGCSKNSGLPFMKETEDMGINILDVSFSENFDTIVVNLDVLKDLNGYSITDTSEVEIRIAESANLIPINRRMLPQIYDVERSMASEAVKEQMTISVIADLTLPQKLVDRERDAVRKLYNTFSPETISLSIMAGDSLSQPMPLTEYSFKSEFQSQPGTKRLYRSIVEGRDRLRAHTTTDNLALIVMSDGATYAGDMPLDPDQYAYQTELTKLYPDLVNDSLSIYYVNFDNSEMGVDNDAYPVLLNMTDIYKGIYQDTFDVDALEANIKSEFKLNYPDVTITLINPNNKLYQGVSHRLTIEVYDKSGRLLASDFIDYTLGNAYKPIVVGDKPLWIVIVQGVFIGGLILLLCYLVFQMLIPYISYVRFKKKYVLTYRGDNMAYANRVIGDSCYLCKDKFRVGEKIVSKCQHTMHLDCWDELGYHCPEYGRHCPDGSHYYNRHDLFDTHNAPAFARWIYTAIIVSVVTWAFYVLCVNLGFTGIVLKFIHYNFLEGFSVQNEFVSFFGFCVGFWFTLTFSILMIHVPMWWKRVLSISARAIVGGILCFLCFFLEMLLCDIFNVTKYSYLFDWIPWGLMGLVIIFVCTYHTRSKPMRLQVIASIVVGILTLGLCYMLIDGSWFDYRLLQLITFIVYASAIALCISNKEVRSEHYYLAMKGGVKPIDIALYKWYRQDPDAIVTIGRAIDCSISMTWDIMSPIAPMEAEILYEHGKLYLQALEPGVIYRNEELAAGERIRLRHGTAFTIGNTTFTYIEKDS